MGSHASHHLKNNPPKGRIPKRWDKNPVQEILPEGRIIDRILLIEGYLHVSTFYSVLPLAEFAYNNATNETMGVSPFFTNKGYHPSLTIEPNASISSIGAQHFVLDLDDLHVELKWNIAKAQECYQKYVDECCSPAPQLKLGDQVYIKAKYFQTTRLSKKLSEKNLGPYKIIATPGSHSFTL